MLKPNYIRFLGLTFDIPQTYKQLCTTQYQQLCNLVQTGLEMPTLRLLVLLVILQIPNTVKRFIINLYLKIVSLDFLYRLMPYTDFVLQNYHEIPTQYGLLKRRKALSMIEFIRLNYHFMNIASSPKEQHDQIINQILATVFHFEGQRYDDETVKEKAELLQYLHPYIKYSIVREVRKQFDELINSYGLVFPKNPDNQNSTSAANLQEMWFKVARQRAENITKLDEVLNQDATIILFDYEEAIDEYNQTKKQYESN